MSKDVDMPLVTEATVGDYARRRPPIVVSPEMPVARAAALLEDHGITGAPVVDRRGIALGVFSITDVMALALFGPALAIERSLPDEEALAIPDVSSFGGLCVQEIMTPGVWSAREDEPLETAALRMSRAGVHRLVVLSSKSAGVVSGVLSSVDLMRAARDARLGMAAANYCTSPVETVEVGTTLDVVMRKLLTGRMTGMPVTDDGWPVGVISQAELLIARDLPATVPVEEIASPAMLCLPEEVLLWEAADQALRHTTRRILLVRARQVRGILTSVDITRAFADGVRQ